MNLSISCLRQVFGLVDIPILPAPSLQTCRYLARACARSLDLSIPLPAPSPRTCRYPVRACTRSLDLSIPLCCARSLDLSISFAPPDLRICRYLFLYCTRSADLSISCLHQVFGLVDILLVPAPSLWTCRYPSLAVPILWTCRYLACAKSMDLSISIPYRR